MKRFDTDPREQDREREDREFYDRYVHGPREYGPLDPKAKYADLKEPRFEFLCLVCGEPLAGLTPGMIHLSCMEKSAK
jgi:hypothetical protein